MQSAQNILEFLNQFKKEFCCILWLEIYLDNQGCRVTKNHIIVHLNYLHEGVRNNCYLAKFGKIKPQFEMPKSLNFQNNNFSNKEIQVLKFLSSKSLKVVIILLEMCFSSRLNHELTKPRIWLGLTIFLVGNVHFPTFWLDFKT